MFPTPNPSPPYPDAADGEWAAYRAEHAAWQRARNVEGMLHIIGAAILGAVAIAAIVFGATALIGDLMGAN